MQHITLDVILNALGEVGSTVLFIFLGAALLELAVYFLWSPLMAFSRALDRRLRVLGDVPRHVTSTLLLVGALIFVVAMVSPGREPSQLASYWLVPLVAFVIGAFLSPNVVKVFKPDLRLPYMLLVPAIVGLLLLQVYPLLWELNVSFTNLSPRHFQSPDFVGLVNYIEVFTKPVLKQVHFVPVFLRTLLWTVVNLTFHVGGGMALALLLNRDLRFKGVYRTLLVLPWAIPQVIACLAWRGEFHFEYGFVNHVAERRIVASPVAD